MSRRENNDENLKEKPNKNTKIKDERYIPELSQKDQETIDILNNAPAETPRKQFKEELKKSLIKKQFEKKKKRRLKISSAIAACFLVLIVSITLWSELPGEKPEERKKDDYGLAVKEGIEKEDEEVEEDIAPEKMETTEEPTSNETDPSIEARPTELKYYEIEPVEISYEKSLILARELGFKEENLSYRDEKKVAFQDESIEGKNQLEIYTKKGKIYYKSERMNNKENNSQLSKNTVIQKSKDLFEKYGFDQQSDYRFELLEEKQGLYHIKATPFINSIPVDNHSTFFIIDEKGKLAKLDHVIRNYITIENTGKQIEELKENIEKEKEVYPQYKNIIYKETPGNIIKPHYKTG